MREQEKNGERAGEFNDPPKRCCANSYAPTDDEKQISVVPAWIAEIQVRKDAFGDIQVSLGFQRSMLE